MRVLWFGTYSVGPGYPRNTVLMRALHAAGVEIVECHAPLFTGVKDKVRSSGSAGGLARFGLRAALAWARLMAKYFRAGPRDVVVVGYTGHIDVYLARALSIVWRRPVVLDAFLSPYDTIVNDRGMLHPNSFMARALHLLERNSLRVADLVLTDTAVHADFMAETFRVRRSKFLPMPVGSLIESPIPIRLPVAAGGGGVATTEPFRAFFCGSFVPLQGVPYILDAASHAPDLRFKIVGDGVDGPAIEAEVARRGLANVDLDRRFIGKPELERELGAADAVLGIFGSTPKTGRVIPCKVYDGLAAGCAVVTGASRATGEMLVDGDNALLVDRCDPLSLVAALRRMRDTPGLRDRLRAGARRTAREHFGPAVLGRRLRGALEAL